MSLDKKILQKVNKSPKTEVKTRRLTEFSPFNFKTDERKGLKLNSDFDETSKHESTNFKARDMPKYKFFEVKHEI